MTNTTDPYAGWSRTDSIWRFCERCNKSRPFAVRRQPEGFVLSCQECNSVYCEVLPCPFCGGEPYDDHDQIRCWVCDARSPDDTDEWLAAELWNNASRPHAKSYEQIKSERDPRNEPPPRDEPGPWLSHRIVAASIPDEMAERKGEGA